jgi:GH15 family glucan-1,4-alpha-glucosidase
VGGGVRRLVLRALGAALPWLQDALAGHWDGQYYQSMLPVPSDYRAPYDPNIDIVMAAIYGAIPVTDTKLLATAAQLRSQWADSAGFFSQVGVDASTTPAAAAAALQGAGDQMLQAVVFHSDNLELSEQFDATTGYEKSVSNLTWSYASFLSAVRARTAS